MKNRRSRYIPKKRAVAGFGSAFVLMGSLFILPHSAEAQVRELRIPQDICEVLKREPLDEALLQRIRDRADFVRILRLVDESCPELGAALLQTASIPAPAQVGGGGGFTPPGGTPVVDSDDDDDYRY